MSLNFSNILNILFFIALGYIFSKTIGPALMEWFYEKVTGKKLNKEVSLDELIEKKKKALQNKSSTELLNAPSKKLREKNKTAKDFKTTVKINISKEKDQKKKDSYQKIIDLFDALQWGDGEEIKEIKDAFLDSTKTTIESTLVTRTIKELDQNNFYLKFNKRPLTFKDFSNITQSVVLMDMIENSTTVDTIVNNLSTDQKGLKNALRLKLYALDKVQRSTAILNMTQELEVPIFGNSPTNSVHYKYIKTLSNYSPKEILKSLKSELDLIKSISPLEEISSKDSVDKACEILGVDKEMSLEDMKLLYRKLAKRYHPDTLSGEGVPSEALDIASQNFAKIKTAFEIFKEHKK